MSEKKKIPVVRVDADIYERVKAHVEKTRQSIVGFFSIAAEEKLNRDTPVEKSNSQQ